MSLPLGSRGEETRGVVVVVKEEGGKGVCELFLNGGGAERGGSEVFQIF